MPYKILCSAPYIIPVFSEFAQLFEERDIEVILPEVQERLSEDELMVFAGEIDGTISGDDRFSAEVLKAMVPRLKVISKWGTGIDSINVEVADQLGVKIFNTPDAFTDAVADTVMAYVLAFARKTPWMDREMKAGRWHKIPGKALHECTLGVVGVGRIGKTVLRRAVPFGMQLLGNDIVEIDRGFIRETGMRSAPLDELLGESDFVSLNCDLNPTSRHLIDRHALSKMKPSAVIINTARGSVVVEEDLILALQSGQIAGAGLDVYEDEPLPSSNPLLRMENVLLAPHNANSSPSAWRRVHIQTVKNLFLGLGISVSPAQLEA
jgi:D-3-phosphoglycerate dehydrogenase